MLKIEFNDTAKVVITHPVEGTDLMDDEGKPMTVTVYGSQSKAYREAKNRQLDRQLKKKGGAGKTTAAEVEEAGAQLLADCTASFDNLDIGVGELEITAAKYIYLNHPWLKDQIDAAIVDNSVFLKTDSTKPEKT